MKRRHGYRRQDVTRSVSGVSTCDRWSPWRRDQRGFQPGDQCCSTWSNHRVSVLRVVPLRGKVVPRDQREDGRTNISCDSRFVVTSSRLNRWSESCEVKWHRDSETFFIPRPWTPPICSDTHLTTQTALLCVSSRFYYSVDFFCKIQFWRVFLLFDSLMRTFFAPDRTFAFFQSKCWQQTLVHVFLCFDEFMFGWTAPLTSSRQDRSCPGSRRCLVQEENLLSPPPPPAAGASRHSCSLGGYSSNSTFRRLHRRFNRFFSSFSVNLEPSSPLQIFACGNLVIFIGWHENPVVLVAHTVIVSIC